MFENWEEFSGFDLRSRYGLACISSVCYFFSAYHLCIWFLSM